MSRLKIVESMRVEPLLDALAAVLRAPTSHGTRPGPFVSEQLALGSRGMRETVERLRAADTNTGGTEG